MIPILLLAAAIGCNTRAPQPQRDGDAEPGVVQRARSPATVTGAAEPEAATAPPEVDTALRWQIAATRGEGALRLRYADGTGEQVVFRDDLSVGCEVSPYQHPGAVLAMRCGRGAAARAFVVRRVDDTLSVYEPGGDGGSSPLAQVTLRAGLSRVTPTEIDDGRRPADDEVLLSWVISHYQDVSLTVERPGQGAHTQWLAELIGCDPAAAPPPALRADDIDLALLCRHQGRTETLAARAGRREVVVVHELSSDGLERHRIAVHRVALGDDGAPAKPADAE
ncbi:MAG: hypothetical protein Tsb0020_39640 [Haliangiales bacterium]